MKAKITFITGMAILIFCFLAIMLLHLRISMLDHAVTVSQQQIDLKLDRIERTLNNANP